VTIPPIGIVIKANQCDKIIQLKIDPNCSFPGHLTDTATVSQPNRLGAITPMIVKMIGETVKKPESRMRTKITFCHKFNALLYIKIDGNGNFHVHF
jgi:hypothetical protein